MKIKIENIGVNTLNLMRQAGYNFQRNEGQEMSFIRTLAQSGYPRFHIYLRQTDNRLIMNIHLDQKKNTYGKSMRHHAEYEDEGPLKIEVERIRKLIGEH